MYKIAIITDNKPDTFYTSNGDQSMIDHQRDMATNAHSLDYLNGSVDVAETLRINFHDLLTEENITAIVHDDTLMDMPFNKLFQKGILKFLSDQKERSLPNAIISRIDEIL